MFGFLPHNLFTNHIGQNTTGLSPRLWSRLSGTVMASDGSKRLVLEGDDFTNFEGNAGAADSLTVGGYGCWTDTTTTDATINPLATEHGGVIRLSTSGTDNHQATITSQGGIGTLGAISDTAGSDYMTVFEARVRFGQIADHAAFIGLSEEALDADNTLTDDDGDLASKDFLGFHVDTAGPTALDFVHRKAGGDAAVLIAGVQTLAASTWYKIGFIYDPAAVDSRKITVYVDNVEQSTYGTASTVALATFPDGEELAMNATIKTGAAADKNLDIDWWAFGQLIS